MRIINPDSWPPPPDLLPGGDVDKEAIRAWVALHVFGDAESGSCLEEALLLEIARQVFRKGLERLRSDLQDDIQRNAGTATKHESGRRFDPNLN